MSSVAAVARGIQLVLAAILLVAILPVPAHAASTTVAAHICRPTMDPTTLGTTTPNPTTGTTAALSGTAEPSAVVEVRRGATIVGTTTVDGAGNYGLAVPLIVGQNDLTATANDACGHTNSSSQLSIERIPVPPPAPTIITPASGSTTTDATIFVGGTAEADATIEIARGGVVVATVTAASDGSYGANVALALGINTFDAVASNLAGPGPRSGVISVTRLAAPQSSPTPTPKPTSPKPTPAPAPIRAPIITSPTSGVTITEPVARLTIQASPGDTVEVLRAGERVGVVAADGTGIARVDVPLELGRNRFTARVVRGAVTGPESPSTEISRTGDSIGPVISGPTDNGITTSASVTVTGLAEPGVRVIVVVNGEPRASGIAGSDGGFSFLVPLEIGDNILYVRSEAEGTSLRSSVVIVRREPVGVVPTLLQRTLRAGRDVGGTVMGSFALTLQGGADLFRTLAADPAARTAVFSGGVLAATLARGLAGLDALIVLVMALIYIWGRRRRPGGRIITIEDSVSGRPAAFTLLRWGRHGALADASGRLRLPRGLQPGRAHLLRPGYRWAQTSSQGVAAIEPIPLETPTARMFDALTAAVGWLLLILAAGTALAWVVHEPSIISALVALTAAALIGINCALMAGAPSLRWGKVSDQFGRPIAGAQARLRGPKGHIVSTYVAGRSGQFTLRAPVGVYTLEVEAHHYLPHSEAIQVRHHPAYLTFDVRLHPDLG